MPTVLIVDDSAMDRKLAGGLLSQRSDIDVVFAVNGLDAWEKIEQSPPDLVVTDLIMPEMDGLELVAKVVSGHPLVPIILMTGRGSEETAVRAAKTGAASYVPKNILSALLLDTVETVLEASHEEMSEARLMSCLTRNEMVFQLGNDATMIGPLVNHLHRSIRTIGLCDEAGGIRVCVALEEAINNALFHGNLEITSQLRTSDTSAYQQLVKERIEISPYCERSIHVQVKFTKEEGIFKVRDEGPGFDPESLPDPTNPENIEKAERTGPAVNANFHGRSRIQRRWQRSDDGQTRILSLVINASPSQSG